MSSYSVFYANRRDKIYASIRIASPRPTIVRNDNVSQINFPAIIPESVTSHDLTAHRSHPYPNCRLLSSLHPRETKSRRRVSSVLSILEYRRKWKKIWKIGKWKMLRNYWEISLTEKIYIYSVTLLFLYAKDFKIIASRYTLLMKGVNVSVAQRLWLDFKLGSVVKIFILLNYTFKFA